MVACLLFPAWAIERLIAPATREGKKFEVLGTEMLWSEGKR